MWPARTAPTLFGRRDERAVLESLLRQASAGESSVLVLRGEAGIGKTALLEFVAERATGCSVVRAVGVQADMELAFAGLHHLCVPMLHRMPTLPAPQRSALHVAFGLRGGEPPERFLVALAVLTLLAETADERPLVCLIEDAQWLERASAQVLAFVARRLLAERIAMVFAVREPVGDELAGLPELRVDGPGSAMPARCWRPSCPDAWPPACASGSWLRRAATRSRSVSFLAG